MTASKLPPNIQEFNEITAVLFGQLYASLPNPMDIDKDAVARALGLADGRTRMSSGRAFNEVLSHTVQWLIREDFVRSQGKYPLQRMVLTKKGLAGMSAVPPSLSQPLGSELADATKQASTEGGKTRISQMMGDFWGSFLGSFTKSISG